MAGAAGGGDEEEEKSMDKQLIEKDWNGIIIDWAGPDPVVFWSETFPDEIEYKDQLEVISEIR